MDNVTITANIVDGSSINSDVTSGVTVQTSVVMGTPVIGDVVTGGKGDQGDPGEGVPVGGTDGQVLTKQSGADYDTDWETPAADAVTSVNSQTGAVVLDADDIDDASTTNKFTDVASISKLAGIEAGADVTDATNVNAAGATMNSDTTLAGNGYFLDEDDMASDSATKVPSQQSVKAYVDAIDTGTVDSVVAGNNIDIDATDPANPIVSVETLTLIDISDITASAAEVNVLDGIPGTLTATELGYVDGVTSSIQTQLNTKIENLSSFDTDDLAEGAANLYSQWEINTYGSTDFLQPKDATDGVVIGSNLHSSITTAFAGASAIFNGDVVTGSGGINYFLNLAYNTDGFAFGGVFASGHAGGTPSAPTQVLADKFVGGLVFTTYGTSGWVTGGNHLLPGLWATTATDTTTTQELDIWIGGLVSSMIKLETDTNAIKFNEAMLDADITFYYGTGTTLVMDGATGNITAGNLSGATANSLANIDTAQTFSNKRITKRIQTASDATSITPAGDTSDLVIQSNTQATGTLTINAPTGTPTDGQALEMRIKSTNVQTFSFNSAYTGSTDTPLPTATYAGSTYIWMKFEYNNTQTKWNLLAITDGY